MVMEGHHYDRTYRKRVWIAGALLLVLLILISVCFFTKTVTAQRSNPRTKMVASIEVEKGDSLWSIASEYMSDEYDNIDDYIKEIKESNGMSSNEIHAGNYIIIPYFADAAY
jgi:cell division protein YceG involved in septum cleavage